MAYQGIGTGTTPNDNTGDSLFTGAVKINSNFTEIYNALGDGSSINLSKSRTITAGNGLTGGGDLSADITLNVGQGDGITVSADTVAVDSTVIRTSGGQTISGALTVNENITGNVTGNITNTVTGTNTTELVRGNMADNDQFRILIGGTASDDGFVEIATGDNGNEPIYVRQYTGVFSSVARTATLLDSSGNTSFPGDVTISGNLTANGVNLGVNVNTGYYGDATNLAVRVPNAGGGFFVQSPGGGSNWALFQSGGLTVSGTVTSNVANGTAPLSVTSTTKVTNLNVDLLDGIDSSRIVFGDDVTKTSLNNDWDSALSSGFYNQEGPLGTGTPTESWYHMISCRHPNPANNYQMQISGNIFDVNDLYYRIINSGSPTSWYKIWHSGNDGSGSGLDADLLDGLQSSSANTPSTIVARDGSGNIFVNDVHAVRSYATNTGAIFFNSTQDRYLYYNGTDYELNGAGLNVPRINGLPYGSNADTGYYGDGTNLAIRMPAASPGGTLYIQSNSGAQDFAQITSTNSNFRGALQVNTGAVTTGDALVVQNAGDLRIYNSGNAGSIAMYCDTNGVLTVGGNLTVNGNVSASSFGGNLNTPFQPNISVSDKTTTNGEVLSGVYYVRDFIVPDGTTCILDGVVYIMAQRNVIIDGNIDGQGIYSGANNDATFTSGGLIVGNYIGGPGSGVAGGRMPWGGKRISAITSLMGSGGATGNASGGSVSGTYTISAGGLPGQSFIVRASGYINVASSSTINLNGQGATFQSSSGYNLSGGGGGSGGVLILDANQNCINSGQISAIGGSGASGSGDANGGGGGGGGIVIIQSRLGTASVGTVNVSGGAAGSGSSGFGLGASGGGGCGGKGGNGGTSISTLPTAGSAGVVSTYGTPW
jgi:hypothetical protein